MGLVLIGLDGGSDSETVKEGIGGETGAEGKRERKGGLKQRGRELGEIGEEERKGGIEGKKEERERERERASERVWVWVWVWVCRCV